MTTINKEVIDAFVSTLQDLTVNSKPLINVLTMIADENEPYSKNIVEAIETHLAKVRLEVKLPILYLIDCIIKNVGRSYTQHFCQNIVTTFCGVFQVVDEKTRAEMFKLRQTWNDVLPKAKLYAMDVQIRQIDPAWPITAHLHPIATNTIHVNPKFLNVNTTSMKKEQQVGTKSSTTLTVTPPDPATLVMQQKLLIKQKELVELQQKKIELELLQTKVKLEEEKLKSQLVSSKTPVATVKQSSVAANVHTKAQQNLLLKPEVAKQLDNGCNDDNVQPPPLKTSSKQVTTLTLSTTTLPPYTIPKHAAGNNRFASIRDPRLARLQQQQTNNSVAADSTTPTVSNIPVPQAQIDSNKKKHNINNQQHQQQQGRPPNKISKRQTSKPSTSPLTDKLDKIRVKPARKSGTNISRNKANTTLSPVSSNTSMSSTSSSSSGGSPLKLAKTSPPPALVDIGQQEGKFRDLKGANKRRNYVRRNNLQQERMILDEPASVEKVVGSTGTGGSSAGDTDLRSLDSFVVGSNASNQSPKLDLALKGVDVDLRQIPTNSISGTSGEKKRSSSSAADNNSRSSLANDSSPPAKKSKSQVLDALFGSEDVDLRQATTTTTTTTSRAATPPPPPPPIISSVKTKPPAATKEETENKVDIKKANLDALRAKLASVSNKEKQKEKEERKVAAKDTKDTIDTALLRKIIMSNEDVDCIKAGKLSREQETAIMAKIKSHFESEKLAQAKLKEKEEEEQLQQKPQQPSQKSEDMVDSDDEVIEVLTAQQAAGTVQPALEEADHGLRLAPRGRGSNQNRGGMPQPWQERTTNRWGEPLNRQQAPPWQQQHSVGNTGAPSRGTSNRWGEVTDRPMGDQHIIPPPPMPPVAVIDITQQELQPNNTMLLQSTSPSDARSINIDSIPRDIRFYDQTAIVFMAWDDPREISFQHGTRRVIFDDTDIYMLQLNDPEWTEMAVSGQMHRVKLGAPTRELWLDGRWYETVFGGRPVEVDIDGRVGHVRLEGPPPQVRIGTVRRTDLVVGKIQIIVDAKTTIPVFLDSRIQQITLSPNQPPHQLQFVDALRAVRFDGGNPIAVEFGGLPKPVFIAQKKHFVRFSVLPRGVRPGFVRIQGMEGVDGIEPLPMELLSLPAQLPSIPSAEELAGVPVAPPAPTLPFPPPQLSAMDENSQDSHQNLGGNFDALSNAADVSLNTSESEYNIETRNSPHYQQPSSSVSSSNPPVVQENQQQNPLGNNLLNINDLFQKLLASGIVVSTQQQQHNLQTNVPRPERQQQQKSAKIQDKEDTYQKIQVAPVLLPINWNKADTLKTRQTGLVQLLYSGMQCSSCGERFPAAAAGGSRLFSQHLDWHFRQNRRGKNSARNRKATSRRWYYSLADWKQYEEIEDLRERAEKNFFENQQQHGDDEDEDQQHMDKLLDGSGSTILTNSVACDPETTDPHCFVCEDRFEQFYNEELEEWHLRNAVSVDGQIYHPVCYKDQQTAAQTANAEDESQIPGLDMEEETTPMEEENDSVEEVQVIKIDDDEDNDENNKVDLVDDIEVIGDNIEIKANQDEALDNNDDSDDDDDDVILNEVQPEQIILDEYEWRSGQEPSEELGSLIPGVVVKIEPLDDGFMDVGDSLQKAQEPDVKDETAVNSVEAQAAAVEETTYVATKAIENDVQDLNGVITNEMSQNDKEKEQLQQAATQQDSNTTIVTQTIIEDVDVDLPSHQQTTVDHPMMANIDGNIDMSDKTAASHGVGRIRINISKVHAPSNKTATPATTEPPQEQASIDQLNDSVSVVTVDPPQPLPPGEEPPLKPGLRGVTLRRQAPVNKGTELTGLCSIM